MAFLFSEKRLDYNSAGNFHARIPARLCGKIIGGRMYYYGLSDYFRRGKTVGKEYSKGVSAAAEQGRQVPGMVWVGAGMRVIVGLCIGKWVGFVASAGISAMDMKPKHGAFATSLGGRQACYLCRYHSTVIGSVEPHGAVNLGIIGAAVYFSNCVGLAFKHGL